MMMMSGRLHWLGYYYVERKDENRMKHVEVVCTVPVDKSKNIWDEILRKYILQNKVLDRHVIHNYAA